MSTESELRDWRRGPISAERLCAGLLGIERYTDIEPQAPLGGADGTKDILATRDGKRWVAAVFFPPTSQSIREIEAKFKSDVQGVERNACEGFVFFVNQHLTLGERAALADSQALPVEIYDVERIRRALDSPKGYGLRLEHVGIQMSLEDQTAFFSELQDDVITRLLRTERSLSQVDRKLDQILERTTALSEALTLDPSSLTLPVDVIGAFDAPTSELSLPTLSMVHRMTTEGSTSPPHTRGKLRAIQVFVGDPTEPAFVPPPPEAVPELLVELLRSWRERYPELRDAERREIVDALARFHHRLVSIHPFLDGNGRVARVLTDQAAGELLSAEVGDELVRDPAEYFACLKEADEGDLSRLSRLIAAALR